MPNTPITNPGLLYVNGMIITRTSAKTITVSAGNARDSSNTNDISLLSDQVLNGTHTGVNGVDVAPLTASSGYALYVIGDSTKYKPGATVLSNDIVQPALPAGYDMYRRIGWALTDSSADILKFWQCGNGQVREWYHDAPITVLTTGAAVSFTEVPLITGVPPIVTQVLFEAIYTPNLLTGVAEFLPFGSLATSGMIKFGYGVAGAQTGMVTVPCQKNGNVPTILYKVNAGDTLTLSVSGFIDYI